jgi:crossover junction endodeoxyribonuclease RuvC
VRVAGLDLSLTSTGLATPDTVRTLATKLRGVPRLLWLREAVLDELVVPGCDVVAVEGYSIGSPRATSHGHAIGELGGVIRVALYEAGIEVVEVAPAQLKLYATGKGNASKDQVLVAAVKRSGIEFDGNDQADAWWLRQMACSHYGLPWISVPQTHLRALEKIDWPVLERGKVSA